MKSITNSRWALSAAAVAATLFSAQAAHAGLVNGGFETVNVPVTTFVITAQANVPGWKTTSTDGAIEIWRSGFSSISGGPVPAYEGQLFAEINATQFATLYQDVAGVAADQTVGFQFAHRGRAGVDVMRLIITDLGTDGLLGGGDDTQLFAKNYSTGQQWAFYTSAGEAPITTLGHTMRFSYQAVSTASGDSTVGNFIDAADFGVGVGNVPEPGSLALIGAALAAAALVRRRA